MPTDTDAFSKSEKGFTCANGELGTGTAAAEAENGIAHTAIAARSRMMLMGTL